MASDQRVFIRWNTVTCQNIKRQQTGWCSSQEPEPVKTFYFKRFILFLFWKVLQFYFKVSLFFFKLF
ncbi:hypothetical protein LDENG_00171830 [Lucifuga dentata]|nr:hypothetical protein LDENG_00171830 [Lucifuga dentata]